MTKFSDKVRSMSAKEIILTMVESLRNPACEVSMATFGSVAGGLCFGCAATNTIAKLMGQEVLTPEFLLGGHGYVRWPLINDRQERGFIHSFELAIDALRVGEIECYNDCASDLGMAEIPVEQEDVLHLPTLRTAYSEGELQQYEDYANNHC